MIGKISTQGYKDSSPDKNNPYNIIPGGNITMFGVGHPVFGVDNLGNKKMMYPNQNYKFQGSHVLELPMWQMGGQPTSFDTESPPNADVESSDVTLYGHLSAEDLDGMKSQKYIRDPKRREQHIRDVYENMLASGVTHKQALQNLQHMGGYGTEARGLERKTGWEWGFDHKDIDENKLLQWNKEYNKIVYPNYKKQFGGDVGGLSPEDARQFLIQGHAMGQELSPEQRTYFANIAGTDEQGNLLDENGEPVEEQEEQGEEEARLGGEQNYLNPYKFTNFADTMTRSNKQIQLNPHPYFQFGGEGRSNKNIQLNPFNYFEKHNSGTPWDNKYIQLNAHLQFGGEPEDGVNNYEDYTDEAIFKKGGNWLKGAVNPAHKGFCTPMTKSTCTPRRKAFAETMKKHHGFRQDGGEIEDMFFQSGGGVPNFNSPQEHDNYYRNTLHYQEMPNAKGTFYNPKDFQFTPNQSHESGYEIKSLNPNINLGGYNALPAQNTYTYQAPTQQPRISQPSSFKDTSGNPYRATAFGDHGPTSYLDTRTNKTVSAQQVMQERQSLMPQQRMGGESDVPCYNCGGQMKEGGQFLKALIKGAYKDVMKKGGESTPQGSTGQDILASRNSIFKNYLSNNAMYALANEESQLFLDDMHKARFGGMYQQGGDVAFQQADDSEAFWGNKVAETTGNTGVTSNPMPQGSLLPPEEQGGYQGGRVTPFMSENNPVLNPQTSEFSKVSQQFQKDSYNNNPMRNPQQKKSFNGQPLAEGIIGGLNFGAAALNARQNTKNSNTLRQRMDSDSLFQSNQAGNANRGDYDSNSGMYRPNQMVPTQQRGYQMGGEHQLTDSEIAKLRKQGYKIQYLD